MNMAGQIINRKIDFCVRWKRQPIQWPRALRERLESLSKDYSRSFPNTVIHLVHRGLVVHEQDQADIEAGRKSRHG